LIVNSNVRNIFVTRSKIINYLRRFLDMRNFVEVETPSMFFFSMFLGFVDFIYMVNCACRFLDMRNF